MNCRPSALELARGFGRSAASAARTAGDGSSPATSCQRSRAQRRLRSAVQNPPGVSSRMSQPPSVSPSPGDGSVSGSGSVPFRRSPRRAIGVRTGAEQERTGTRDLDVGAANRHVDNPHTTAVADHVCRHVQCRHRRRAEHVHRQSHNPELGVMASAFHGPSRQTGQQSPVQHVRSPRTPSLRHRLQPVCARDEVCA